MGWGQVRRRAAAFFVASGLGISGVVAPTSAPSGASRAAPLSPPEGSVPDRAALGWQPVFDEPFDGTALDETVWTFQEEDPWASDGIHSDDTVSLDGNGLLKLSTYTDANGQDHV